MTPGQPPSTPDPRKFFLAKRNPPASQDTTPRPRQFQPSGAASSQQQQQRFHATPRFAPASSSASTPRPPPSTPGFGFPGTARRQREAIVDDGVDSSPTGVRGAGDSIEVESAGEGDDAEEEDDTDAAEDEEVQDSLLVSEGPTPKRRRVEVESEEEGFKPSDTEQYDDRRLANHHDKHAEDEDETMLDAPQTPLRSASGSESEGSSSDYEEVRDVEGAQKLQPTFQRAPRFRASEGEAVRREGLPEAFSPQRRGVRYIPGGLAAEMQSWLAEVKGWDGGHERPVEAGVRFAVEEVEAGSMMYLVNGRKLQRDVERSPSSVRLMLAGEGKLTGLAKKAEVHVGAVIVISQPAWEVALGQGDGEDKWVVACDWLVQTGGTGP